MTPADFASAMLAALEASEGRRRCRKRDQTPDAIGLGMKRALLERVLRDAPGADEFEAWLLHDGAGPMAGALLDEWRLAAALPAFARWLERGAPSDDAQDAVRP